MRRCHVSGQNCGVIPKHKLFKYQLKQYPKECQVCGKTACWACGSSRKIFAFTGRPIDKRHMEFVCNTCQLEQGRHSGTEYVQKRQARIGKMHMSASEKMMVAIRRAVASNQGTDIDVWLL